MSKSAKTEPSFTMQWGPTKPPPGAAPGTRWRKCTAGCKACGYGATHDVQVDDHDVLKVEESMLKLIALSATPVTCLDFTAYLIVYAYRDEKRKAIANRVSVQVLHQIKLIEQGREDEEYGKKSGKPHKAAKGPRRNPSNRRRERSQKREETSRTAAGAGVPGRNRRKTPRAAKRDRGVEKKTRV